MAPVCDHSLCDPLPQLTAGRVRVGGENDQAALGVVHVAGCSASALLTLRQWIPGYPRCTEPFLQRREERGPQMNFATLYAKGATVPERITVSFMTLKMPHVYLCFTTTFQASLPTLRASGLRCTPDIQTHHQAPGGRNDRMQFGKNEIENFT